jgi:5-methylcytosine-specific restriction enzyme A
MNKTPRISIPPEVRQYILERNNFQCQSCNASGQNLALQIDHIIPLAKGGTNDLSNLQVLCQPCNSQKSDRIDTRFDRLFS